MFDRLFGWFRKKSEPRPDIMFGRYSDNNKTVLQVNRWTDADNLFKEKKYQQSVDAFFDYLRDETTRNVETEREGELLNFTIYQGSKVVRGHCDNRRVTAEVSLARMPEPSIPVMRRLLEQNYLLYYTRYTLHDDRICMRFETDIETANPNKLYYGLKELATKADKQDDLLVQDFTTLEQIDSDHVEQLPEAEKNIKLEYFRHFIRQTVEYIDTLDREKLAGGISYMLLALGYRLDFLIAPEGKLLQEMEKAVTVYFSKEDRSVQEKNHLMTEVYRKMLDKKDEDILPYLFRSTSTFSIVAPQPHKVVADAIQNSMQNMQWYKDNKYPEIARQIMEYGISYCQYSYSLPRPLSQLFMIFMEINYPDFFLDIGFKGQLYDPASNQFEKEEIEDAVEYILSCWRDKYPFLSWKPTNIRYDNILSFNQSFLGEIQSLNFDGVN